MSIAIQFRRGTTTNHSGFAGLLGEITFDTTKHTLVCHDGSTLGGFPLSKEGHTHTTSDISGLKYQVIQISGSAQTAQPNLNFSNLFVASNDTPNNRTTITLANNNTTGAGTYGTATKVPQLVLNAGGLITSVTEITIAGTAPGGSAGGDLKNTYPNPGVASVGGAAAADIAAATSLANAATNANTVNAIVKRDATGNFFANVITAALVGDVTGNCSGSAGSISGNLTGDVTSVGMATTLATVNSNVGTFGTTSKVARITVNGKGLITAVTEQTISGFVANGDTATGDLGGTYPAPTVSLVGGVTASNIAAGATAANNATSASTASKIVLRDGAGSAAFANVFLKKVTVTTSATPSFDVSTGAIQQMTINANITSMTVTGMTAGQIVIFDFVHDNTDTGYSIAWASNVFGGSANVGGTLGTSNNKHNNQMFWSDGTNLYALDSMRTDLG